MTPDQRLRLFAALLGEGRALVLAEAGETDRTLAWARNIDAALAEYRGMVQQVVPSVAAPAQPVCLDVAPSGRDTCRRDAGHRGWCHNGAGTSWRRDEAVLSTPPPAEVPPVPPVCKAPDWCGDEDECAPVGEECVSDGGANSPDYCSEECGLAADERKRRRPPREVPPGQVAGSPGKQDSGVRCFTCGAAPAETPIAVAGRWSCQKCIALAAPAKASEPAKVPLKEATAYTCCGGLQGNHEVFCTSLSAEVLRAFQQPHALAMKRAAGPVIRKVAALEARLATAERERDAANERANETGCELDGVRAEVEQLRAKLADITAALASSRQQIEAVTVDRRAIIDEADARELAMRDACAKLARDFRWVGDGPITREIAGSIERLPVGAGEAGTVKP